MSPLQSRFAAVRADLAGLEDLCLGQAWRADQLQAGLRDAVADVRTLLEIAERYGWNNVDDDALSAAAEMFERAARLEKLAWEPPSA